MDELQKYSCEQIKRHKTVYVNPIFSEFDHSIVVIEAACPEKIR